MQAEMETIYDQFPTTLTVTVTDADIIKGRRCDSRECPIALAVIRTLAERDIHPRSITVGPSTAYVYVNGPRYGFDSFDRVCIRYNLPPEAAEFIFDFDGHRPVTPITLNTEKAPGTY